jgi:DcmR-like sensory protein
MCVDCRKVRSVFTPSEERWERRPELYSAPQPAMSYTLCPECASLSVPRSGLPRHQCLIYDGSPTAQLSSLAATTRHKLKTGHRCLFLNSPIMIAGFRSHLRAAGVDVAHEIGRGALVLSFDQSHLENGQFHVDRMLALLKEELAAALRGGYSGLWATGDMKWELGNERNFDKLLEYECRLEEFLRKNPTMSGVCQVPPGHGASHCPRSRPVHAWVHQ